jgi:zinc/manganese transport system substrate-binding protein
MNKLISIAALAFFALPAHAALHILSCEPEWQALAKEIGGDKVDVVSATTPDQDVHYIQARPSLIAQVRRADLVVCTGADLEVGWLPVLLRQGGNSKVQPGQDGYLEASSAVQLLEVPTSVDRSQGDVHPYGNPHLQLDPRNIGKVASALTERMAKLDSADAALFHQRSADFLSRWNKAVEKWTQEGAGLKGMQIVTHHRSYVYLDNWLGLEEVGSLEPKPGVEPTTGHLAELLDLVKTKHVKAIVRSSYQSSRASDWLGSRTQIREIVVPQTVGSVPEAKDLFSMFDTIISLLNEANK